MEALATYLIKSSVWLTGFALVYALFLRNERFFVLNRIYLVSGILISIIFPFFTWHYTVVLPVVPTPEVFEPQIQGIAEVSEPFPLQNVLLLSLYISGIIYLTFRILRQTLPVFRIIRKSETQHFSSAKLIRTAEYSASFSFFSFVFVNPSIDEIETNEIVNHELEHIRQQHWIDLLLFEILRTVQWFNPAVWLYGHLIRQNHEYLADERALQRSSNPAIYRAALLNQMFGGPVISLANSFNYSLNKKRFNMMKQTISSPIRKLKLLLILPLIAGVFYAFAAPEYKFIQAEELATNVIQNEKTIKGKVIDESGKPLKSASVIIAGKTIGTITDDNGNFMLKVTDDSPIVISYVGFENQKVQPTFEKEIVITMKPMTFAIEAMGNEISASKPSEISDNVMVIIDGKESTKAEMEKIDPDKIASIDVLKDKASAEKYGEKGKNGVILIKTKNASPIMEFSAKETEMKEGEGFIIKEPQKIKFSAVNSNQPLYILDGKEISYQELSGISPEKIESISVLKNESATKMYGEKGKNGVVLIESKKTTSANSDVTVVGYGTTPDNLLKSGIRLGTAKGNEPLIVRDGVISPHLKMDDINPNEIESINVLKNESATTKYGENGKNGVLEINMKKTREVFTMVEEMPQFPGGVEALKTFVYSTLKYPTIALENGIQGQITVKFVIDKTGSVKNVRLHRGVDPSLDKEGLRIIESMPKWTPGKQNGETVDVAYEMPINFKLPPNRTSKQKLMTMSAPSKTSRTQPAVDITDGTQQLIIVPNPTNDKATITLKGSDSKNKMEVSVYDRLGKLIKKESKNGPTFSLSFNKLPNGTYFIVAKDGENQFTGQLVVSH
ncbi:MAG: TonB family protein [Prolixibacteraceae bacterium]|nr:TonB family protein [Prolixibacteraceae bacterium]